MGYNKEKLGANGEIKDLEQVKSKSSGKESEMFLELTKKYKDKAIERRIKPKPPPYTPPDKDTAVDDDSKHDTETLSAFQSSLKSLEEEKAKAAKDEDFGRAADLVDEIKELKRVEIVRLRAEKK